jgi:hypothetical protein
MCLSVHGEASRNRSYCSSSVSTVTRIQAGQLGPVFRQWHIASRSILGPTKPPVIWVHGIFPGGRAAEA